MSESTELVPLGLPCSSALAEADPQESLAELMSRDPEGYQQQDLDRLVLVLREQRARFERSEAEGKVKKQPRVPASQKTLISGKTAEDLGL